jgi:hypothetical protein
VLHHCCILELLLLLLLLVLVLRHMLPGLLRRSLGAADKIDAGVLLRRSVGRARGAEDAAAAARAPGNGRVELIGRDAGVHRLPLLLRRLRLAGLRLKALMDPHVARERTYDAGRCVLLVFVARRR